MCSCCKMDPRDVKIMRMRQGAVGVEDFYKEVNYTPKKKVKAKPAKQTRPGCSGNEGKRHIYVWTTEFNLEDLFFKFFGFHKYEKKFCAGCSKRQYGTRKTERYVRKFKDQSVWGSPEYQHEGFREYRQKWLTQRGYTSEVWGNF